MRQKILDEIRRLTEASGGQPPGRKTFEQDTGIRPSAWLGVFWARWGDAVAEAGFNPNAASPRTGDEFFFEKMVQACRHYGRVPTAPEFRLYRKIDQSFPADNTFRRRFGGSDSLLIWVSERVAGCEEFSDVASMLAARGIDSKVDIRESIKEGLVYLIKSGTYYKVGRSDELERRVKEIRVAQPDAATLEHSIRTDDPPGIEAYWHRRFNGSRVNGEWFKLAPSDVKAFKKRKFQ